MNQHLEDQEDAVEDDLAALLPNDVNDNDDEGDDSQPMNQQLIGTRESFPCVLVAMLEEVDSKGDSHIVSWQPHGRCFTVNKRKSFVETIMPLYFRMSKFASFQRQLNLYGFRRITKGQDKEGYYHEHFLRHRRDLCDRVIRLPSQQRQGQRGQDSELEPNFYAMPYLDGSADLYLPSSSGPPNHSIVAVPTMFNGTTDNNMASSLPAISLSGTGGSLPQLPLPPSAMAGFINSPNGNMSSLPIMSSSLAAAQIHPSLITASARSFKAFHPTQQQHQPQLAINFPLHDVMARDIGGSLHHRQQPAVMNHPSLFNPQNEMNEVNWVPSLQAMGGIQSAQLHQPQQQQPSHGFQMMPSSTVTFPSATLPLPQSSIRPLPSMLQPLPNNNDPQQPLSPFIPLHSIAGIGQQQQLSHSLIANHPINMPTVPNFTNVGEPSYPLHHQSLEFPAHHLQQSLLPINNLQRSADTYWTTPATILPLRQGQAASFTLPRDITPSRATSTEQREAMMPHQPGLPPEESPHDV